MRLSCTCPHQRKKFCITPSRFNSPRLHHLEQRSEVTVGRFERTRISWPNTVPSQEWQAIPIHESFRPDAPGKQADQAYIYSTLGIRYLTLYVKDLNRALERVKKAGITPLGETPVEIGNGTWLLAVKDPDGNFIELIGPRR
jgi:predicted enzyme related to lactoylglutathione lyase